MTATTTPRHEIEVLVARNCQACADGLPPGWLTEAEAAELMVETAIGWAAGHAEVCFLVLATPPALKSKRVLADWIDRTTTAAVADMMAEGHRAAELGGFTEAQLHRLQAGRAAVFDARLAELQAVTILPPGRA